MTSNNFIVLGIGGRSQYILNYISQHEPNLNIISIDNDEENLNLDICDKLLFKDFASIGEKVSLVKDIVVIMFLGGSFVSEMGHHIIKYLLNHNKDVSVIAIIPFIFEGKHKLLSANLSVTKIEEMVFDTTIYNSNTLIKKLERQVSLNDVFQIINESIYDIVKVKFLQCLK